MILTNLQNLPAPLVRAVQNDSYDKGDSDYSTTGLLRPPRMAQLLRGHGDTLTEDVSDRLWALMGQVMHSILERAAAEELVEKRLFMEIAGKKISGQIDLWDGKILQDWKLTSVWVGKEGAKEEWEQQGNINRLLCHENGIEVEGIQYIALYRDWSKMKAMRDREHPQQQVEVFNLPIWTLQDARRFVEERIRLHEAAKEELSFCTPEEMWETPEKWAVKKKGNKRATKLYDTEAQAQVGLSNLGKPGEIEHRPGQRTRCEAYCPVSSVCTQYREWAMERMGS